MVVHSPKPGDRTARGASAAAGTVPPSVVAAAAAPVDDVEADLLGDLGSEDADDTVRDFDAWDGEVSQGAKKSSIEVDVHTENEQVIDSENVTMRRGRGRGLTVDPDRISVVGSVPDATTPPNAPPPPSQLNPFTPEWFEKIIGTAVAAAASAAVASTTAASARQSTPTTPSSGAVPRRLNERKVPDFWEDRPEFWFRIFDAHLSHFNPSEQRCFDALLPLLTPAARTTVHSVIRTPGGTPYSKAREALLRHFGRTPRQLARELRDTRSMGDMLATELLDHLYGLLPDVKVLFEVILLDALPANARVAALQHSNVRAMARAADEVILENRAAAECVRPAVSSLSLLDGDLDSSDAFQQPLLPQAAPAVAAVSRGPRPPFKKTETLCAVHNRYGKEAYKCMSPRSCRMHNIIKPRPASSASGNGKAGSQ